MSGMELKSVENKETLAPLELVLAIKLAPKWMEGLSAAVGPEYGEVNPQSLPDGGMVEAGVKARKNGALTGARASRDEAGQWLMKETPHHLKTLSLIRKPPNIVHSGVYPAA